MKRILWLGLILLFPVLAKADLHPPSGGIANSSAQQAGAVFNVSSGTVTTLFASSATIAHILGTTTNDNATAGTYGEYKSSVTAVAIAFPTSNTFGDLLSLSLTAGDWDVTAIARQTGAGGSSTTELEYAITTTAGNDGTGIVAGDNDWHDVFAATINGSRNAAIPAYRMSVAATTTIYLKYYALYTVATPTVQARLSARRIR